MKTAPAATNGPVVTELVMQWFADSARELPWRDPSTPAWGVFVSEVMSQQTPVARVAPAWLDWMARWPTPADLAAASPAEVIRAWATLGYPRRALWLREAAAVIRDDFGGQVPSSYADLLTLPGVGDYTAAAVAAFAYRQRTVVLDTNVRRVIARVFDGQERPASASATRAERDLAEQLAPADGETAALWAVASMELGAVVCRAAAPACPACPVSQHCSWLAAGLPVTLERPRKAQKFTGTDRQVRGKILAVLRATHDPVTADRIEQCWPDSRQRDRCLDSLVADGLVEPLAGDRFRLPG